MAKITTEQAYTYAALAGFTNSSALAALDIIVAIAHAESDLVTNARNTNTDSHTFPDGHVGPSTDRGVLQINDYWWPQFTDAQCDDPAQAFAAGYTISRSGTYFNDWVTYWSGAYQNYLVDGYSKTTFTNGTAPGISTDELNKLGDGLECAHADVGHKIVITGGDSPTHTHTYTDATLLWSRGGHWAQVAFSSGGDYPNVLYLTVGPAAADELRVINNAIGSILRVNGNQIDAYKWWNIFGYPMAQFQGDGKRVFAQTGDPGSNAEEGDVWFKA